MSAHSWSTADIPSLTGTTAVVTGANSGIGWHTAAELARHGADVTLAVRNADKGEAAAAKMRERRRRHRPGRARSTSRRSPRSRSSPRRGTGRSGCSSTTPG